MAQIARATTEFLMGQLSLFGPGTNVELPEQAQIVNQRDFNVLGHTLPPAEFNASSLFVPPGMTQGSLLERPFHVYDAEFLGILGENPSLTRVAESPKDPLFHEAVVWMEPTEEVFFVQNAGHKDAGTGMAKSAVIEKISLAQAAAASNKSIETVDVTTVTPTKVIPNPNGATNFRGKIVFASEGQGADVAPALWMMDPKEPYNAEPLLNNFFGRQFNSINDVAVNPRNKELYFTDTIYGYVQDFRPAPGLQDQVYRFNPDTGAVTVVADGFVHPNGFNFSPDGKYAYVSDTGIMFGFSPMDLTRPSTIYRFDVLEDGTFANRKTFAFVNSGAPDGIHCDTRGNVYAGCGDGVQVWNPSGKLLGKIYLGTGAANFNFAGKGRMVICAETALYYVTLAAEGSFIQSEM